MHNKNRVLDNFDLLISSQNGLKQTHDLAMILKEYGSSEKQKHPNFTRLSKTALKDVELDNTPITFYKGPKNPKMQLNEIVNTVLPLKVLAHQKIVLLRKGRIKFHFFS